MQSYYGRPNNYIIGYIISAVSYSLDKSYFSDSYNTLLSFHFFALVIIDFLGGDWVSGVLGFWMAYLCTKIMVKSNQVFFFTNSTLGLISEVSVSLYIGK